MTVFTEITTAPTAPSRDDPTNFRTRADAYVDWQSGDMVPEINTIVATLNDAMPDLWLGTSTTSMTIGAGSKSFTVAETLLFFGVGTVVRISDTADPTTNYMDGSVTAYTGSTGAMTVMVTAVGGAGTKTAWSITPQVPVPLLGTVATYDVTTSTTDTTADRITKVGDWGLGGTAVDWVGLDWNDCRTTGFFRGNDLANQITAPGASSRKYCVVVSHSDENVVQIMVDYENVVAGSRVYRSATWTDWVAYYHTANQLYTVVAANTTMVAHRKYSVNTSAAARTMTLPATATAGDWVEIVDAAGTFHLNNCTIARNSHNIMSLAENLTADEQNAAFKLVYVDATYGWRLA